MCIDNARRKRVINAQFYDQSYLDLMSNVHPSHTKEEKLLPIKTNIKIELVTVFDVGQTRLNKWSRRIRKCTSNASVRLNSPLQ